VTSGLEARPDGSRERFLVDRADPLVDLRADVGEAGFSLRREAKLDTLREREDRRPVGERIERDTSGDIESLVARPERDVRSR
jgi:hypothetical protein